MVPNWSARSRGCAQRLIFQTSPSAMALGRSNAAVQLPLSTWGNRAPVSSLFSKNPPGVLGKTWLLDRSKTEVPYIYITAHRDSRRKFICLRTARLDPVSEQSHK